MMKAILGRFTTPPAGAPKVHNGATPAAPAKVAATSIKGAVKTSPAAKPVTPESAQPVTASKTTPKAPAKPAVPSPPPPPAKKGVLESIAARVYG